MTIHRVEVIRFKRESTVLFVDAPPGLLTEDDGTQLEETLKDFCWTEEYDSEATYCEIEEIPANVIESQVSISNRQFSGRDESGKLI